MHAPRCHQTQAGEQSLMAAKQEAELACQAKTDFLTTMSHEIRTPLYGVMGSLELLALTSITAQQRRYLDALQHSSNALLATVNNTLDLARIEAGHQSLEQAPFSPLQLVEEVVSSFAMRAESKGLQLYCMVDASTLRVCWGMCSWCGRCSITLSTTPSSSPSLAVFCCACTVR